MYVEDRKTVALITHDCFEHEVVKVTVLLFLTYRVTFQRNKEVFVQ